VFFLNCIALEVGSTNKSGETTLSYLDGCEYAVIGLGDVEFGSTAAKGDIIVGVTNSDHNNLVTLEVIAAQKGTKRLTRNGVDIDGTWYDVATSLNGGMLDDPDFQGIDKGKTYDWYVFSPVYGLLTGWNTDVNGVFWSSAIDPDNIVSLVGDEHDTFSIGFTGALDANAVATGNPDNTTVYYLLRNSNSVSGLKGTTTLGSGTYNLHGVEFCNAGTLKTGTASKTVWGTNANGVNVSANNGWYVIAVARNNTSGKIEDAVASAKINVDDPTLGNITAPITAILVTPSRVGGGITLIQPTECDVWDGTGTITDGLDGSGTLNLNGITGVTVTFTKTSTQTITLTNEDHTLSPTFTEVSKTSTSVTYTITGLVDTKKFNIDVTDTRANPISYEVTVADIS